MEKETFIKRLVELRMGKGVSARDMSLSLGQSAGYINNIESGVNYPSMAAFSISATTSASRQRNFLIQKSPIRERHMSCWRLSAD